MTNGFQNIVNAEDFPVTLYPNQDAEFHFPGHCLNERLKSPSGQDANIIPLKVSFEFSNQRDVWENIKKRLQI